VVTIFGDFYINDTVHLQSLAVTVMDSQTGFVLYQNAQHDLMYPASVTKVLTALVVLEETDDLQQTLVFSEHSVHSLPHYASRVGMAPGDAITVYEALYGLMLPSGNDVANALAEHISGNIEDFVAHMNIRAAELGAANTRFVNPCGLPGDGQHTTAYDMALIMQEAIRHPVFNEIIASPGFLISPTESSPEGLPINNTNRLIHPDGPYYNPRVIGGKTGFTNAAQHTLVSYANQGEHSLIVSVLHAPRGATFTDTTALLDHIFSLPIETIFESANQYWEIPVMQNINGALTEIGIAVVSGQEDLRLPIPENMPAIHYQLYVPETLPSPIHVGDVVGYKTFYAGDTFVSHVELVSTNTILPQAITPSHRQESTVLTEMTSQTNTASFSFFTLTPVVILILIGMLLMLRRRKRIRQRRIAMLRRRQRQRRKLAQLQYEYTRYARLAEE